MEQTHRGRITKDGIRIHEDADFEGMRAAGQITAQILDEVAELVRPGATTGEIDAFVERRVTELGTTSATIGYKGYKHASCISINHVVCHGIPGAGIPMSKGETASRNLEKRRPDDKLLDGDILNIDITVIKDGWFGDSSRMYVAGRPKKHAERLIQVTHDALMYGIDAVKPGNTFGDIRLRDPELRRKQTYVGGTRFLWPRSRSCVSLPAQRAALWSTRTGAGARRGNVFHHRTDDQSGTPRDESPVR